MWSLHKCLHNLPKFLKHFLNDLAAWQKLLSICRQFDCVHIKKEFFAVYTSGYKNCGMKPVNFFWFFFSNWLMPIWNPLLIIPRTANLWWDRQFTDRIFMPQHAEALPKLHRIHVHIILTIYRLARPHFAAFCRTA